RPARKRCRHEAQGEGPRDGDRPAECRRSCRPGDATNESRRCGGSGMKLCGFEVGLDKPFFLISGPCVVESEQLQMDVAGQLKEITSSLGIPFIFKSSYDKANRSSGSSFRGPGMEKGLEILAKVKRELKVPILTDVH